MIANNFRKKRTLIYKGASNQIKKPSFYKRATNWISKSLKRACMVIGALFLVYTVFSIASLLFIMNGASVKTMSDKSVLLLKIEGNIPEVRGGGDISEILNKSGSTLDEIITAIDVASRDDRIKGLVLSLRSANISLTQAQEIRNAVLEFRKSGKFTTAYSVSYGDGGSGLTRYYLASAFDTIWMQPIGIVSISGFNAEMPYFKELLDKVGVKGHFLQRKEYKTAMENITNSSMSKYNRETLETIIDDFYNEIGSDIAENREIDKDVFFELMDKGLFVDVDAQETGLVDRLGYGDMVVSEIKMDLDNDPESENVEFVTIRSYYKNFANDVVKKESLDKEKELVAVVHINGAIVQSAKGGSPLGGGSNVAAASVISGVLYDIADDEEIKVVLLRVNSPGGSPAASETIRRAILKVKEKGKKVVVSMGSAAASGGYWVSADADYIFAQPATLTGSIGVVGGKIEISGISEKLGINWERVSKGENSTMWSVNQGFSKTEEERISLMMDNVYDNFVKIVANGRSMTEEEVDKVAKGRAWSGNQALEKGLVDELGGYMEALDKSASLIGKVDSSDLDVIVLPREKKPIELIIETLNMQAKGLEFISSISPHIENNTALEEFNVLNDGNGVMIYDAGF